MALLMQITIIRGQEMLTRIPEIRALSPSGAEKRMPVKIRGVVTWSDSSPGGALVVDDGTAGIWVATDVAASTGIWKGGAHPDTGSLVEVEGFTDPGGYAPVILPATIIHLGERPLPPARKVSLERLHSGADDAQRVQVTGVARKVEKVPPGSPTTFITLAVGDEPCIVRIEGRRKPPSIEVPSLVDAEITVRGIFTPVPNIRGEMVGLRIHAAGWDDVEVVAPAPKEPFAVPHVELDRLLPFSPEGNPKHRQVTSGVVTFSEPGGFFFMQEGITGVKVQPVPGLSVKKGDRVEVAGFVEKSRWLASLTGALVRKVDGPAATPAVLSVKAARVLHPDLWDARKMDKKGDCDSRLVKMEGILRKVEGDGDDGPMVLRIESDDQFFLARLQDRLGMDPDDLHEGSRVSLTGVSELIFGDRPWSPDAIQPSGFQMWIDSPSDIRILGTPSWWTLPRLGAALGIALTALLGAAIWISTLQRAVRRHAVLLENSIRYHRDAELEFLSARKERLRLATDLHDGLQQMLVGVGFRLEAALAYLGEIPDNAREEFQAARKTLMGTLTGLRECLWGLRHVDEGPEDFAALLRHGIDSIEHWPQGAVTVASHGDPYPLTRDIMGNLLLLVQEAVGNAFQHGHAEKAEVILDYDNEGLEMTIRDNGCGFDPAKALGVAEGHFGIEGMRERTERLGGRFHIASAKGEGTAIRLRIPPPIREDETSLP